tara:strand:+ start:1813 stop:2262 length:450 start_codon:yes stop_codon:yes gene_type:complete
MNDKTMNEDIKDAYHQAKEQIKSLEEKQELAEKLSGTLNDPNETDVLMKVGKIDDGSQFGRMICVLKRTSQNDKKQYYVVFEMKGFVSRTDPILKKDYIIDGNIVLDGKDYALWGYEKTGESQKGKYDFISLSLAVSKEEKTNENGTSF